MNFIHHRRKPVSILVSIAFIVLLCLWSGSAPAAPERTGGAAAVLADAENDSPGVFEKRGSAPVVKTERKAHWLLIGAATVVAAAAVYFLVLKKPKYDLTVTLGQGCSGTPAMSARHKRGEVVRYSYALQSGFARLQVTLDGAAVAASGSVTMDKAHAIVVSADQGAMVNVTSNPSGARIYDNYADTGKVTPASLTYSQSGSHHYLLRLCGHQDHTLAQSVSFGHTHDVSATLLAGIGDDFLVPASCWAPHIASEWSVAGGIYRCRTQCAHFGLNYYDSVIASSSYALEVKMRKVQGVLQHPISILLATSTNMNAVSGYWFCYDIKGNYSIWEETGVDWVNNRGGSYQMIQGWRHSAGIRAGLNAWNTMKIVRSGNEYSLYMNGHHLISFNDASHDPRVVVLTFYCGGEAVEMQYDSVRLDLGAARIR